MTTLRAPGPADLPDMSALCLRSKGYWGYPPAFIDACRAELTLDQSDLDAFAMQISETSGRMSGVVAVSREGSEAELELLFVDPPFIGLGIGRVLFEWAATQAKSQNASWLRIAADPGALPFYQRMGATLVGEVASDSAPGRSLPLLTMSL